MNKKIAYISLLVHNYDDAIDFYVNKLNFLLLENTQLDQDKRWVVVSPSKIGPGIVFVKAENNIQTQAVGNQSGGNVFLIMHTQNFEKDYQNLVPHNVFIVQKPVEQPYGRVAVFKDLYGNLWDLIQPK